MSKPETILTPEQHKMLMLKVRGADIVIDDAVLVPAVTALPTRDTAGRFAKAPHPCCETCGAVLAERLNGDLACARARCSNRGSVVGNSGADVGVLGGAV